MVLARWQLLALVLAESSQLVLERQARTPRHQSAAISLLLLLLSTIQPTNLRASLSLELLLNCFFTFPYSDSPNSDQQVSPTTPFPNHAFNRLTSLMWATTFVEKCRENLNCQNVKPWCISKYLTLYYTSTITLP